MLVLSDLVFIKINQQTSRKSRRDLVLPSRKYVIEKMLSMLLICVHSYSEQGADVARVGLPRARDAWRSLQLM